MNKGAGCGLYASPRPEFAGGFLPLKANKTNRGVFPRLLTSSSGDGHFPSRQPSDSKDSTVSSGIFKRRDSLTIVATNY